MTYKAVAKYMHKSEDFIWKWYDIKEQKNVYDFPDKWKMRRISKKEDKIILKLFSVKISVDIAPRIKFIEQKESEY